MNNSPLHCTPASSDNPGDSPHPIDRFFWREQWRQLKLAHCAVPNYGNSRQFWGNKKKVHTVYTKGNTNHDEITRTRLDSMSIPDGSRVLDIGAGPGTYAIPLAARGCKVTVVEPSPVMRELLEARIQEEKIENLVVIPKRWEDVRVGELGEPFDAVIASYSLTMMDIGEALEKMNACCRGTVHLFWFLLPPAWVQVNRDLWPFLHGGIFPGEPTADWLWQVLYEMEIYANLQVDTRFPPSRYANVDEAVEEFLQRLNCTTPAQEETVRNYFQTMLRQDGDALVLGDGTLGAHLWWSTV
ncbi:class I SAM-dependent methyltransferase [Methanosphaerula palustris]|uniref:Methyltransferase type 11 n=1 Tax=Methanosphaerula palustris (strain ATCC BAA-1556 / DSM 19958 / E1-9c) TaxID=521011 RepID=B8GIT9_METPE|nr:class I SAM-dependent methyltransferase [Methanosphaerula palustris]ACL16902.1 Methyltransferase type 11 [Methanosphaerula palustris E1-9c]